MIFSLLFLLGFAAAVFMLGWDDVKSWLDTNRTVQSDYAKIISSQLQNGKYTVVAGIFSNSSHTAIASTKWECSSIDDDLKSRFSDSNEIRIEL